MTVSFPHKLQELANIHVLEEYDFTCGGKKYIAIHGDQFDTYIQNDSFITKIRRSVPIFSLDQDTFKK